LVKGDNNMKIKEFTIKDMTLLPAKKGTCPICATKHEPNEPHNQQSLFYQVKFFKENGRYPTWEDAMAHCSEEMKNFWIEALRKHGITIKKQGDTAE